MDPKTSTFSNQMKYFGFLLKKNLPFFLGFLLYYLITLNMYYPPLFSSYSPYYAIYWGGASLGSLPALLAAVVNFKFLTSRGESDLYFSMPINRTPLFFTHYFAGLFSLLLPQLLCQNPLVYMLMNSSRIMEAELTRERLSEISGELLMIMLTGVVSVIAVYTLAVFFAVNIGRIFDVCFYFIVINLLLPYGAWILNIIINSNLLGITGDYSFYSYSVLQSLPLLILNFVSAFFNPLPEWAAFVIIGIFSLVFLGLSCLLFRLRKVEKAHMPFAFEYLKIVLAVLISLFFGLIASIVFTGGQYGTKTLLVNALVFFFASALAFLGCMAISKRSFQVFDKKLLYFLLPVAAYGVLFSYTATDGFGRVTYVPKAEDVAEVSVTAYPVDTHDPDYSWDAAGQWYGKNIHFTEEMYTASLYSHGVNRGMLTKRDSESIRIVTEFHQSLLEHYKQFDYSLNRVNELIQEGYSSHISSDLLSSDLNSENLASGASLPAESSGTDGAAETQAAPAYLTASSYSPRIIYTLKSGRKITRSYSSYPEEWMDDSYEQLAQLNKDEGLLTEKLEIYLKHFITEPVKCSYFPAKSWVAQASSFKQATLSAKQYIKLVMAIYRDELEMSEPSDYTAKDYVILDFSNNLLIYNDTDIFTDPTMVVIKENYHNTKKALDEIGWKGLDEKASLPASIDMEVLPAESIVNPDNFQYSEGAVAVNHAYPFDHSSWEFCQGYQRITDRSVIQKALENARMSYTQSEKWYAARFHVNDQISYVYILPAEVLE